MTTTAAARAERLARARKEQAERGVDALLLGPSADLAYLTGYRPPALERLTMLVLPANGDARLVVPALEAPLARDHLGELDLEVAAWPETGDPVRLVAAALAAAGAAERPPGRRRPAVERLPAAAPGRPAGCRLHRRLGPDPPAAHAQGPRGGPGPGQGGGGDRRGGRGPGRAALGRPHRADLHRDIEQAIRDTHDEFCFAVVASGPNAASPHHTATGRVIQPGDPVVVDIGGRLDGYCSDTTRTLAVDEPPAGFPELYALLHAAQLAGCAAVRPGVTAAAVDAACRDPITAAGHGELFLHRTGHGIGLDEHEDPYIVAGNDEPLEPGMAFSIEPGIYAQGHYGARIEDIVVCTDDGGRRLNTTSRGLRIVS